MPIMKTRLVSEGGTPAGPKSGAPNSGHRTLSLQVSPTVTIAAQRDQIGLSIIP